MTEMQQPSAQQSTRVPVQHAAEEAPEATGWVGWIIFAGVMMIMMGIFHACAGLLAIFNDEYYLVGKNGLAVSVDYTAWGWTHLILGVVVGLAGVAVMNGKTWARTVAVILAGASALLSIGFLSAYPVWSAIIITLDVLVIYSVTVHGREVKSVSW
jgi:hypothetical protein